MGIGIVAERVSDGVLMLHDWNPAKLPDEVVESEPFMNAYDIDWFLHLGRLSDERLSLLDYLAGEVGTTGEIARRERLDQ